MPWFVSVILLLIVVGVLVWGAQRILAVIEIAEPFKTVIYVLIVVLSVFFLISVLFGGGAGLGTGLTWPSWRHGGC